jgi:hypothetical protein
MEETFGTYRPASLPWKAIQARDWLRESERDLPAKEASKPALMARISELECDLEAARRRGDIETALELARQSGGLIERYRNCRKTGVGRRRLRLQRTSAARRGAQNSESFQARLRAIVPLVRNILRINPTLSNGRIAQILIERGLPPELGELSYNTIRQNYIPRARALAAETLPG